MKKNDWLCGRARILFAGSRRLGSCRRNNICSAAFRFNANLREPKYLELNYCTRVLPGWLAIAYYMWDWDVVRTAQLRQTSREPSYNDHSKIKSITKHKIHIISSPSYSESDDRKVVSPRISPISIVMTTWNRPEGPARRRRRSGTDRSRAPSLGAVPIWNWGRGATTSCRARGTEDLGTHRSLWSDRPCLCWVTHSCSNAGWVGTTDVLICIWVD
ncbi:hypothetical protein F5888DRAFT_538360 [Russula emetica]|nr:hypothetical protein F5888DRAFT_538360 [Russula emetica]